MAPPHTRTLNPLPFGDLEPKRFEDLVRQLLYDFRQWRSLEATGRAGSDDGFDARGWEVLSAPDVPERESGEDLLDMTPSMDRIWLVQCKREKSIPPKKLKQHLEAIDKTELAGLHGIILAAPTDFSKTARDDFLGWCRDAGVQEAYLWGRGELEDMLFQPKNDHLLFAYFGISLAIRRRSRQATLRARTTIKRKLKRALENRYRIIVRDADDEKYPWADEGAEDKVRWWVFNGAQLTFRGLEVVTSRYFARVTADEEWDAGNAINDAVMHQHMDPWRGKPRGNADREELYQIWSEIADEERANFVCTGVIKLERILEVDELGDDFTGDPCPHVFASVSGESPFDYHYGWMIRAGRGLGNFEPLLDRRRKLLPDRFRKSFGPGDPTFTQA